MSERWTDGEVEFLRSNLDTLSNEEIAEEIGRTPHAVAMKLQRLGWKRPEEFRQELRRRAQKKGRESRDYTGENNPNWKGGSPAWQRKPRKQVEAHNVVNRAIENGDLERQPCEVCGAEPAEAHHEDYDEPLNVTWLCRKHHMEVHGLL